MKIISCDRCGVVLDQDKLIMRFDKISDLDILIAQLAIVRAEISRDEGN